MLRFPLCLAWAPGTGTEDEALGPAGVGRDIDIGGATLVSGTSDGVDIEMVAEIQTEWKCRKTRSDRINSICVYTEV